MRLLLLTETYPPDRGGMAESCDRIARGLAGAGIGLDLAHFDRRSTTMSQRLTSYGSIIRVPATGDPSHAVNLLWNGMQELVERGATTHVVAFGGTLPLLAAPVFAAWMRRPLVTLIRGNELDAGLFDPRRRPILDDAIRRSAAVATVTTAQAEKIAALHPSAPVHVVSNGLDLDLWQQTDADAARAREWRAATVAPDRRVLGMFGHLKKKKGTQFFVDALLRSSVAERFHLLAVGELEDELPPSLAATVLPPLGRFELISHYLACDLVVLPSHYDGCPNVLIEAAALGRPLIASAVGGMRDLLTDGVDAFLFAPGDEHACRDGLERAAAASDAMLARFGASAAAMARQRCDSRDETRSYVKLLERVQEEFDANADVADRDRRAAVRRLSPRT
jgi:glycogen(starch) synthase